MVQPKYVDVKASVALPTSEKITISPNNYNEKCYRTGHPSKRSCRFTQAQVTRRTRADVQKRMRMERHTNGPEERAKYTRKTKGSLPVTRSRFGSGVTYFTWNRGFRIPVDDTRRVWIPNAGPGTSSYIMTTAWFPPLICARARAPRRTIP